MRAAVYPEEVNLKDGEELSEAGGATKVRSLAATLNYKNMDRSEVQHAAKGMYTEMARFSRDPEVFGRSDEGDVGQRSFEGGRSRRLGHGKMALRRNRRVEG